MSNPTFYRDELNRSLDEQASRVQSFVLTTSGISHAEARITTLEAYQLHVRVTVGGYEVLEINPPKDTDHFETLDDLLTARSPAYVEAGMSLLFAKLEQLRAEQKVSDEMHKDGAP
ncbi:hypothetical protein BKA62DRAFT_729474 [Auriculariales sp. MPI-PUGE-AT-0066]|nr:hypothetical protein BKA62DRAFT_729474 [Auriculariales sp. MPI-PUGE-AT-0066]